MNKRVLLTAFLSVFLSSSMLGMPFIVPTKSHPADIIVPDDYEEIQWAVGNASDRDAIFVRAGIYVENVVVNKSVLLIGENSESTIIDGDGFGTVLEVTANNVTVANFTIRNSGEEEDHGIYLNHVKNTIIQNNNVINNYYGVCLYYSSNNILEDLIVDSNDLTGMCLYSSSSNQLINTTVSSNERYGIQFVGSSNNRITNSRLLDNGWLDFYIAADHDSQCNHALINVNGTENKPIVYYNYSVTIQNWYNNVSEIVLANADNSIINNVTMTRSGTKNNGIRLVRTDHTKISNTRVVDHAYGVLLIHSSNNHLTNITANANSRYGVYLWGSSNNTISENNITNNRHGIWLSGSSNNKFYHDTFIDNVQHVHIETSGYANFWDDGYPSGGNYWSDYGGKDLHKGSDQDIPGSDGIGDAPYIINENNIDHYPLMTPWFRKTLETDLNGDGTVNILDIALVASAYGSKLGDPNWNPAADVVEPYGEINILDIAAVALDYGKTV